jgi:homoserine dehydrogenase
VPLRYEAAVVAGVPFLGTFARRPLASRISAITGIVNGTTNYILSEMHDRSADFATALARAQRNGFAEPDPSKDIDGFDAVEKLVILVRQFMRLRIAPADVATSGIRGLTVADLTHAREFGGCLKPVVYATQSGTAVTAFAGPAFVPSAHPLAQVPGASNGVCVRDELASQVCFTGPGAGPDVTAVTILDDVVEAVEERAAAASATRRATVISPIGAWLVRLTSRERLPEAADVAGVFGAQGVWLQRASSLDTRTGTHARWFLTYPCGRDRLENATTALTAAARCSSYVMDALSPEP